MTTSTATINKIQTKRDQCLGQLESYLESGDFVGAKKAISDFVKIDLTSAEKGQLYVDATVLYLKMSNRINALYLKHLKDTTDSIKSLMSEEKEVKEKLRKMELKEELMIAGHEDSDDDL